MILISTSQTFRSWDVIFHLRRSIAFLSLSLYDMLGLAPRMNVLFWWPDDFQVNYSNRVTSWNVWHRHSGSFLVDTGISFSNMKSPKWHPGLWPVTLTLQPIRLATYFMTLIPSMIFIELWVFSLSSCNGCCMPLGNDYPSGHMVPSPFWDFRMFQLFRLVFL